MELAAEAFATIRSVAVQLSPPLMVEIDRIGVIKVGDQRHPSVADHLYVAIINQQLSGKTADAIWSRIVAVSAARGCAASDLFVPELESDLKSCGVSRNKIRALQAVKDADARGFLDEDHLASLLHEARAEKLCQIWGIGRWTADMVGISHFMDPDIWPDGDVSATATLRHFFGGFETAKAAAHFAPYRSYLARYMWRIKDGS